MQPYQPPEPRLDWVLSAIRDQYRQACRDAYHQGFMDGFKAAVENQQRINKQLDELLAGRES